MACTPARLGLTDRDDTPMRVVAVNLGRLPVTVPNLQSVVKDPEYFCGDRSTQAGRPPLNATVRPVHAVGGSAA